MLRLLIVAFFHACFTAAASLKCALPAIVALYANLFYLRAEEPQTAITGGLFAVFIIANTLFVYAALRRMTVPGEVAAYWKEMKWGRRHTDFLVFACAGIFLLGAFVIFCFDMATLAYQFSRKINLVGAASAPGAGSVLGGGIAVFLFGAKLTAAVFLCVALFLWFYCSRVIIKAPAHSAGRYLSTEEALDITRLGKWGIFASSLLVNGVLCSLPVIFSLSEGLSLHARLALLTAAYWPILHSNMALWVATYEIHTAGYPLRHEPL